MTKKNQEILKMINDSNGHLTAEEAFLLAKKKHIDVSLASIYRILNKLAEEGMISKFSVDGEADVFDKTVKEHGHLVCDVCGQIKDIEITPIRKLVDKKMKEDIDSIDIKLHYICEKCKKTRR